MSELKVNTITSNSLPEITLDDALIVNETLEVTGVVTLSNLSVAGYVTNDADGVLSTIPTIPGTAISGQIPAERIGSGNISNAEFECLDNVTSNIQAQIDAITAPVDETPVGSIVLWPNETPPTGWLECNGNAISKTTYASLYAVLGYWYTMPANQGSNFNLPDLRGVFVRGWNHARTGVEPAVNSRTSRPDTLLAGDHVGTGQTSCFKSHIHPASCSAVAQHETDAINAGSGTPTIGYIKSTTQTYPTITVGSEGDPYESRPINISLMYIIKAL